MDAKKYLRPSIKKDLKGKKINVLYVNTNDKYSKERFVYVSRGYDFLENISVVRAYIQKKHDISWFTLEILIKLMGMKIFSRIMFSEIPKNFSASRWNSFKEKGYVNTIMDHELTEKRLYSLNTKGRNIVIEFYEYLSGEKKIPEDKHKNPMAHPDKQIPFDRKKMDLIKKLNKLEVPEHKRYLFL
jgi:hypothetical protein